MATLRKDFDMSREYSVDVYNCTDEEKKLVQQAFFDLGFSWEKGHKTYNHLEARQYTNTTGSGEVTTTRLMYAGSVEDCNMTAKEFMDLVYEPEQVGHIHAVSMAQYAEDAETSSKPWELWQHRTGSSEWTNCTSHPGWDTISEYRRKPKTRNILGVVFPDFEFLPKVGEKFYTANVGLPEFFEHGQRLSEHCTFTQRMIERGLIYPYTEEGKRAAILHSKTMLGITH